MQSGMQVCGIVVVTSDGYIGRDSNDSPAFWASKEDQEFYLSKIINEKPLGIMGRNTYNEVKKSVKKNGIYSNLDVIILDDSLDYSNVDFVHDEDNNKHIYTSMNSSNIPEKLEFFSNYCNNKNIYILGGPSVYELFMPLYDVFWLTIEQNVIFDGGISLFTKHKSIKEIKDFMLQFGLEKSDVTQLSDVTQVIKFEG